MITEAPSSTGISGELAGRGDLPSSDLPRHIGLASAVLPVIGNVIGSGIFLISGVMWWNTLVESSVSLQAVKRHSSGLHPYNCNSVPPQQ
jgi:hypothetical protein